MSWKYEQYHKQSGFCWLCGGKMNIAGGRRSPDGVSVDHVKPSSMGGTNERTNLLLAHNYCNSFRGNREEVTWFPMYPWRPPQPKPFKAVLPVAVVRWQ